MTEAVTLEVGGVQYDVAPSAVAIRLLGLDGTEIAKLDNTGRWASPDGTVALPGITFPGDPDTGIYRIGADDLGIATAGTLRLEVGTGAINAYIAVAVPDGTAAAPAVTFTGDTNTGIYRIGTDNLGVTVAGAKALDLNANRLLIPNGSVVAGSAGLAFLGADQTGLSLNGTAVSLLLGSSERFRFATDGLVFANAANYAILDASANEVIVIGATASAVNEITITNAATGNAPSIAATGGDTNITLSLTGKGTGGVNVGGAAGRVGFYGTTPVALQTGVAVSAAGIHAALVALGLITA